MILDSSAIVAIFLQEPGYENLLMKMTAAEEIGVGAPTVVESGIVLSARLGFDARALLAHFLEESDIFVISFSASHMNVAIEAWLRYGKGRHPARLNFGDCMAYAVAKLAGMPLLCVGEDFLQTDVMIA
ncbi:MAG: type II toxin-antitoxin system VapC family toxin [Chloroflexi bacterium]|nr:type II toxin-antitoxin system VapC family toxin [Chloroflexota bacterium]